MKPGVDFVGVAVVGFCHDGNGKVIMAKRSENCRDEQGRWDIGGGALEFGQRVEDCLKKEIAEEYCTEIIDYSFLGYRDVHREHAGKKTHWIVLDFKVQVNKEKAKNGEPHKFDDFGWFDIDNMPEPVISTMPYFLKLYKDKL